MTSPSERISTPKGSFTQELPAVCFTEWSLDRSLPHTRRYGRLGFGFPKRVILLKGGQPVSYFKSTGAKQRYAGAMVELMQFFRSQDGNDPIIRKRLQDLKYILSFSRAIREHVDLAPAPGARKARVAKAGPTELKRRKATTPRKPKAIDPFARKFGFPLDLAEEREWRIVFHPDLLTRRIIVPGPGPPRYFVPYKPGTELFTIALPDNRTVHRVLQDDHLCHELFRENRPHVTIVSLEDVGTF